ncbi:MAG: hypothetical protein J0H74_09690 [Chitinophagaceae bacterium]|nr:hypothetical protein [Chitinophagaceae bacterium]
MNWLSCIAAAVLIAGCNKKIEPVSLGTSPDGQLSRYDLITADYDINPVTAFTASYDKNGKLANLFEKVGQSQFSFNLTYESDRLVRASASDQSVQQLSYDGAGRVLQINYTTLTDTGKIVYTYDVSGKVVALLDSVQKPLSLPIRNQYLFTYDDAGNNVIKIVHNTLDLKGRATIQNLSFYSFDDKSNPFKVFPCLRYANLLPGEMPALVNKNNIVTSQLVGTILNPASPGSQPQYDTITTYRTSRTYEYTANGLPSTATEHFENKQFSYSGNRTFKYEY